MFNLDTLDTLIAIVIVLLGLSLIVQSIQAGIKQLLKIKSRQLEESIVDLFENVVGSKVEGVVKRKRLPTLQVFTKHPAKNASPEVQKVFTAVMGEFQEIGRVASTGRRMLDSISKEDLMKVLRKVGPETLIPDFMGRLEAASAGVLRLKTAVDAVAKNTSALGGEASAKFAKLQESLTPLINDIQYLFRGDQSFNKELLLADVLNLREIKLSEVLDLLGEIQQKVGADLTAARTEAASGSNSEELLARVKGLQDVDNGLKTIASNIVELRQKFDVVMTSLRLKLTEIENWYDTVMHSFEERYTRGMKTYAFVISLVLVVWLNANVFGLYRDISTTNNGKRASILQYGPEALKAYEEAQAKAIVDKQGEEVQKKLAEQIKAKKEEINQSAAAYTQFGFTPLRDDIRNIGKLYQDDKRGFRKALRHILYMLFGWVLMAALLSIGAPFWHDTLETLFGVKNLLRKRGDIQNVEQEPGAGHPKT